MRVNEHVIPVLTDALDDHPDGHVLVFLPGSAEITQAIKIFRPPNHVDVFPLYGSLPPEEQQKVFEYNEEVATGAWSCSAPTLQRYDSSTTLRTLAPVHCFNTNISHW